MLFCRHSYLERTNATKKEPTALLSFNRLFSFCFLLFFSSYQSLTETAFLPPPAEGTAERLR